MTTPGSALPRTFDGVGKGRGKSIWECSETRSYVMGRPEHGSDNLLGIIWGGLGRRGVADLGKDDWVSSARVQDMSYFVSWKSVRVTVSSTRSNCTIHSTGYDCICLASRKSDHIVLAGMLCILP